MPVLDIAAPVIKLHGLKALPHRLPGKGFTPEHLQAEQPSPQQHKADTEDQQQLEDPSLAIEQAHTKPPG